MSFGNNRLLIWGLLASIALNLLFIGGITSNWLNRPNVQVMPANLGWIVRDLDEETRQRLRPQLEQYGDRMRPMRGQMFRAQREVNRLMTMDPLDREAILAAFDRLRQANIAYQEITHEQTIGVFQQLNAEQRQRALRFINERRNPTDQRPSRPREGPPTL